MHYLHLTFQLIVNDHLLNKSPSISYDHIFNEFLTKYFPQSIQKKKPKDFLDEEYVQALLYLKYYLQYQKLNLEGNFRIAVGLYNIYSTI